MNWIGEDADFVCLKLNDYVVINMFECCMYAYIYYFIGDQIRVDLAFFFSKIF